MTDHVELTGGSAEDVERELAAWNRSMEATAARYRDMRLATETVQVTESSPDGAVTVTVDHTGQVVDIATTPALAKLKPEQVGGRVLATIKRAQARLATRVGDAMRATLGDADPAVDRMVEQYRTRFPEPVSEPEDTQYRFGPQDPAPAPPRRPRPAARPADDDEDFGGGVLR
ncbi:YbaB/EbfC family nucleoid-associated protein [Actinokineospora sp. NBRC 105648]|uniref:YbaB/EbfC family nucleoid-associated protein n=1 Tax=Actinokineospora sp. NBRC 105648 TaxID=3032206 RepID=UPI0024A0EF21|nr:YbaB/EbfC family nucleoid-associated protein [Actinokineospora sp. NBRC 105648]GLZ37561.1 hypothetical protein Acsp05_11860 [Actinokineospora sp. NBRC 105648]